MLKRIAVVLTAATVLGVAPASAQVVYGGGFGRPLPPLQLLSAALQKLLCLLSAALFSPATLLRQAQLVGRLLITFRSAAVHCGPSSGEAFFADRGLTQYCGIKKPCTRVACQAPAKAQCACDCRSSACSW